MWEYLMKSKISDQYPHPLPRYGNFKLLGFSNSATLFSIQLFSNFYWLKLGRIFIFNSARTFSTFLYLKLSQKSSIKDRKVPFFPLKAETQSFLYTYILIRGDVSLVYRFRGWAKSFPLLSGVYSPAEDDSPQKRTAIRWW